MIDEQCQHLSTKKCHKLLALLKRSEYLSGGTLSTCKTTPVDLELFKAVVQSVLIFGAETWVVNPRMDRVLCGDPGPSDAAIDGEDPAAAGRRGVGVHLGSDGKGRGGF